MSCYRSRWPEAMVFFTLAALVIAGVGACQALTSPSPQPPEQSGEPTIHTDASVTVGPPAPMTIVTAPGRVLRPRTTTPVLANDAVPVFEAAAPGLRRVAAGFAEAWLGYDARHEGRGAVLGRVRPMVTDSAFRRLADSGRMRLPWRMLRDRGERARFVVVGVTVRHHPLHDPRRGATKTVVAAVAGLLEVRSSLGDTKTPASLRLRLVDTDDGWLVAGVHGGGA